MRILLLSTALASHSIKWARALSEENEVLLFSLPSPDYEINKGFPNLSIKSLQIEDKITLTEGIKGKIKYYRALPEIKKCIRNFKPDILHAHWATSYGLIGSLTNFHPLVLSVWGADIYDFPKKSILHRKLVEFNLRKADIILSTSEIMAKETQKHTDKHIFVTPFGVDTGIFKAQNVDSIFDKNSIVVGTIKTLEEKYGISFLIKAFALVKKKHLDLNLKLLLVGGGSQENFLKQLTKSLGIESDTVFTGKVQFDKVVPYYNMLDIYVAVSILDSESFGVAVLEANACEKPVVVSNVGGLPEVVIDGYSGIVVPAKNTVETANAIEQLVLNKRLRLQYGVNGRKRVLEYYDWNENVKLMLSIYKDVLNNKK